MTFTITTDVEIEIKSQELKNVIEELRKDKDNDDLWEKFWELLRKEVDSLGHISYVINDDVYDLLD